MEEKQQQCSETDQPFLPIDIWAQILLRIPAEDLAKLRFVCKSWYQLITRDQSFARVHLDHWKTPRRPPPSSGSCGFAVHTNCTVDGFPSSSILYFTLHLDGEGLKFKCCSFLVKDFNCLPSKEIRLLTSCDGLLLIGYAKGGEDYQLVICNPITGSYRRLPVFQPSHAGFPRSVSWGILEDYEWVLARNPSTGQYKVFRVRTHPDSQRICHIFELQRADNEEQSRRNWKELDAPLPVEWMIETSTIRDGKVYWLAWPSTPGPTIVKILSIDIATDDELRVSASIELLPEMCFCITRNGAFYCMERDEDKEWWLRGLENLDNPAWVEIKDISIEHQPPRSEEFVMPGGVKLVINSSLNNGVMLDGTDVGCSNYLIHWDAEKVVRHVNSLIGFN